MSDAEPIPSRPRIERATRTGLSQAKHSSPQQGPLPVVAFDRQELNALLRVYGRMVADGEWRDYALDFGREAATFSVYRRTSEVPLYRIEKNPKLARKQGAFSVITATGLILKRGHELARVLEVFAKGMKVVR